MRVLHRHDRRVALARQGIAADPAGYGRADEIITVVAPGRLIAGSGH